MSLTAVTDDDSAIIAGLDAPPANGKVTMAIVYAELKALRAEVRPVLQFHQRVLGVLAVARWLGPVGVIAMLGGLFWALLPK